MPSYFSKISARLKNLADKKQAANLSRFFKTKPGDYGEGDKFLGIKLPVQRQVAKEFSEATLKDIKRLLSSSWHEYRLVGLLILIEHYQKADPKEKTALAEFYLQNIKAVNNWDLVDISAPKILGPYLFNQEGRIINREREKVTNRLLISSNLWERRAVMVATFYPIYIGRHQETIALAKRLLDDKHDLIHKAVGWMLREMGKRVSPRYLLVFLDEYAQKMPRTTLRYALERLPAKKREKYLRQPRLG